MTIHAGKPPVLPHALARALKRFLALSLVLAGIGVSSCGSRTGLFGIDVGASPDGSAPIDASRPRDAAPDGAVACTPGEFTFELATAQLMFVVDRSGSMAFSLDGRQPNQEGELPPGVLSRWNTLRDALTQTITLFDAVMAMGAKFYPEENGPPPSPPEEACRTDVGVGIPPARGNSSTIIDVFDRTRPSGGTPTAEAVRLAAQYLATTRTLARTVIVATDGAPNCNSDLERRSCTCTSLTGNCATIPSGEYNCLDDDRTIRVVRDVFENQKIPVYVIGIGSFERPEFLQVLDDMAVAGGRPRPTAPRHYNVQTSTELKAALSTISGSVAKCTYLTPSAPTDPNAITVQIEGRTIPRDATHENGWDWVDRTFGTLGFFGAACENASTGLPRITGIVSCKDP